jgi:hypothetical protein
MTQEKGYFKYSENGELLNIPSSTSSKDDFNFHKGSSDEEDLKKWLALPIDLIEEKVALTMKTIGATI